MSTINQIITNVGINLNDPNQVRITNADALASCQNGYNDIAILSQCIIKKQSAIYWNLINDKSYVDPVADLSVSDCLAPIAIFNNINKRWLRDDLALKQFDQLRDNWEIWHGTPNWWTPSSFNKFAIVPKIQTYGVKDTFDFYYWALAPTVTGPETPLIATDQQNLIEIYATAEQLETLDEFTKALSWWQQYYESLDFYRDRVKEQAKADWQRLI